MITKVKTKHKWRKCQSCGIDNTDSEYPKIYQISFADKDNTKQSTTIFLCTDCMKEIAEIPDYN